MVKQKRATYERPGPDHLWIHMIQSILYSGVQQTSTEVQQKIAAMIVGIQKYQRCDVPPIRRRMTSVWTSGVSRLLRVPGRRTADARPVLLIPSLINGWEIFDILPHRSFARFLVASGFDVYILDWGDTAADPDVTSLDKLLRDRLAAAVGNLSEISGQNVVVMGYCMGGVLMAGAMPFMAHHITRAVYLATPWDFHVGDPQLTHLVQGWVPSVGLLLNTTPVLPNAQVQALFAMIDPDMAAQKFARFGALRANDPEFLTFIAIEDWLRSGRDLPGQLAYGCLRDWYIHNKTAQGTWSVAGTRITPDVLRCASSVVVVPQRDRLVEPQTAQALFDIIGPGHAVCMTPDIGHIGMMSSVRAEKLVWQGLVRELK